MHLLLQSRLKAFYGSLISSKNGNYKKKISPGLYPKRFHQENIFVISTSDGSKIGRVYTVARQGNSDCNSYF